MATIYISQDTGNDSTGDGSLGNPYASIKKGYDESLDGDTLQLLDSAIYQPGGTASSQRIFLSSSINIIATAGQTPTIDGTAARNNDFGSKPAFHGAIAPVGKVISFTGITFNSFTGSANPIVSADNRVTLQFTECTFQNMNLVPIFPNPADASSGTPNLLNRCDIKDSAHFEIINSTNADEHFLFKNSTFDHGNPSTATNYIDCGNDSRVNGIMQNCSVLAGVSGGITLIRFGVIENTIVRNTGAGSSTTGIKANDSRSNNCTIGFDTEQTGGTDGGNNLTNTNPLFVDESSSPPDFQLQSSSPCIDAGKTIAGITEDYAGTSRPQGSAYDIGAYEYVDTGPSFTPTDGEETYNTKFSSSFTIRGTANKLATRRFNSAKDNRQAPFSVTVAGPPTIRERDTSYKNET